MCERFYYSLARAILYEKAVFILCPVGMTWENQGLQFQNKKGSLYTSDIK